MTCRRYSGFTLTEMVLAIVLLGIVSGMLAPVIKNSIDAYSGTQSRSHLLDKVRVALGRLSRELRQGTVPTIDASGSTLEFITTTVGGRYVGFNDNRPRIANTHCSKKRNQTPSELERFLPGEPIGSLCVLYPGDDPNLEELTPAERNALIIGRDVVQVNGIAAQVSDPSSDEYEGSLWKVDLYDPDDPNGDYTFSSASASDLKTYSLADYRHRIALNGRRLEWERGPASAGDFSAADSGLLVDGIDEFTVNLQADKGIVSISLKAAEGGESISVSEDVYVRN